MTKRTKNSSRHIESYAHAGKDRANNPPVGLVTPETDPETGAATYAHDPHIDPQLSWAGKTEHTSFEVPTVSLHVHERIDSRAIVEAVRKQKGAARQYSLFAAPDENPPLRQAIEFYRHRHNWSNRLVAGDSLLVMNSLIEKEGLGGQVQTVYLDPPYGIHYGSNFQPFVNRREVTDRKDADLTGEPEQIRAFRDTWELGIHSYLTLCGTICFWRANSCTRVEACLCKLAMRMFTVWDLFRRDLWRREPTLWQLSHMPLQAEVLANTLPTVADISSLVSNSRRVR